MRVAVERVMISPFSGVAFATGRTDDGTVEVLFAGETRFMVELVEAMIASPDPVVAEIEDWQVLAVREVTPEAPRD